MVGSGDKPLWDRMPLRNFSLALIAGCLLLVGGARAAEVTVRDGNTLQLGDITYRLEGTDAPELDQTCIDQGADPWTCGIDARDALIKIIGGRIVRCDDLGPDKVYKKRHIAVCRIEGETASLNQLLVRSGFALDFEPSAKGRFLQDEASARDAKRGLWSGCFVAPEEFRLGTKDGALRGSACRTDRDRQIREALFPEDPAQPPVLQHQGQVRGAREGHRQSRRLSSAGLSELCRHHGPRSLVLQRG